MPKTAKLGIAITVIVASLACLAYMGVQESKSYYVTIKELHAMPTADVQTKKLRVGGNVVPGSIRRVGTHADFTLIEKDPKTHEEELLKVSYKGIEPPPDTFKDDAQALVVGEFGQDGVFHAREIQAKCASKYAPQQQGTNMPTSKS